MRKSKKIYCNMCGKSISMDKQIPMEDVLSVEKSWGYFSGKDGEVHSFELCEECYDKLVKEFVFPPAVKKQREMI